MNRRAEALVSVSDVPISFLAFPMFVDSHCHLDFPDLAAREDEVLATMARNDVGAALCISVKLEDFPRVLGLAERHPHLWA